MGETCLTAGSRVRRSVVASPHFPYTTHSCSLGDFMYANVKGSALLPADIAIAISCPLARIRAYHPPPPQSPKRTRNKRGVPTPCAFAFDQRWLLEYLEHLSADDVYPLGTRLRATGCQHLKETRCFLKKKTRPPEQTIRATVCHAF